MGMKFYRDLRPAALLAGLVTVAAIHAPARAASDDAPMPNVQIDNRTSLGGFSISAGPAFWSGDFGGPTTSDIFVAAVSLRYDSGPLRTWATLPYMRVESDGVLFAGTDGGPILVDTTRPSPEGRVRDGLGDITVGATWSALEGRADGLAVDLTGRLKLPTASDGSGLSTGKTDVSLSADVSKPVGGVVPFVSAGYRFLGDPDGYDLRNTVSASAGLTLPLAETADTVLLLSYDYDESATRFVDDSHALFAAISGTIGGGFTWTGYGSAGLSDGTSDFSIGALVSFAL